MSARLKFVTTVWQDMLANGGMEKAIIENLHIRSAERNRVVAALPIEAKHTNRLGIIHGGVIAALVDVGGSLAVASNGMFMTGVTTDLATTFLSAGGKLGDEILVNCICEKLGRSMAFTSVVFTHPETQALLARGSHTKYMVNAFKSDRNVRFD